MSKAITTVLAAAVLTAITNSAFASNDLRKIDTGLEGPQFFISKSRTCREGMEIVAEKAYDRSVLIKFSAIASYSECAGVKHAVLTMVGGDKVDIDVHKALKDPEVSFLAAFAALKASRSRLEGSEIIKAGIPGYEALEWIKIAN